MSSTRDVSPDDLERYRIALETAIAQTSLRAVAAAVGMSPTGLSEFLDGSKPRAKTIESIRGWYQQHAGLDAVRPEDIAAQLRRIVATLPNPNEGVANVLDAVERSYRSAGDTPPQWIERVRRSIGAPPAGPRAPLDAAAVSLARGTA
jgi:hypothetical protein